jgi:predicted RNA binding protein YcfA (HicA-like mRNA interferase family)
MPKLPLLSGKEIIKALTKMGFEEIRQKGSHVILKKKTFTGDIGCVVPLHKEVALGTLKGILKQASVSPDEFSRFCK